MTLFGMPPPALSKGVWRHFFTKQVRIKQILKMDLFKPRSHKRWVPNIELKIKKENINTRNTKWTHYEKKIVCGQLNLVQFLNNLVSLFELFSINLVKVRKVWIKQLYELIYSAMGEHLSQFKNINICDTKWAHYKYSLWYI